jgi:outer membrane protein OmpA-like peptidoglycan-associated protein
MKILKNPILLLVLIIANFYPCLAQEGMKIKADKLYSSLSYFDAIDNYKVVVARDSNDSESLIRLADCYRLTNDMRNACAVYGLIIKRGVGLPIHKFYYAQALMQTGHNDLASHYMKEYTADSRGTNYVNALEHFDQFFKDSSCYHINKAPFNSALHDFSPTIYNNSKVVFVSSRDRSQWIKYNHSWTGRAFYRLYVTHKKDDGKYVVPKKFAKSTTCKYNNGPVVFGSSGTSMFLTRNNIQHGKTVTASDGKVKLFLIEALFDTNNNKWIEEESFPYNNNEYNCAHAAISADGNLMIFSSDMPGTLGGMDLWYCIKSSNGWEKPVNLGTAINTKGNEVFPSLINGSFYFSSDGHEGMGGLDIYEAALGKTGVPEGKLFNMGSPINSNADDFGITLYTDGRTGYFSSNRGGLNENDDIYELAVLSAPTRGILLKGIVRDGRSKELLPGSYVFLKNENDSIIAQCLADENGAYSFPIENEKAYTIAATKNEYYDGSTQVDAIPANQSGEIYIITELNKDPKAILVVIVKDIKTNELIKGASLTLTDTKTDLSSSYTTNELGKVRMPLVNAVIGEKIDYTGLIKSPSYFDKNVAITAIVENPGEISVTELLSKPEVGMDVGKLVNINPIYFDLNKYAIRPDAATELDKIVKIMKEYPGMIIELGSHTDCRASAAYNLTLSDNRAKSSAAYIVSKGIDKSRIYGKGYGESKLVNHCECEGSKVVPCTEEEHQMNRRTEFIIIKMK